MSTASIDFEKLFTFLTGCIYVFPIDAEIHIRFSHTALTGCPNGHKVSFL